MRLRAPAALAVDDHVDALVPEGDHVLDLGRLPQRLRVEPRDVGRVRQRPVGRLALVRAPGVLLARRERGQVDVAGRQVEARRQLGLEQQRGRARLGEHDAVELDDDVAGAVDDVDAVERVARVAVVALVLLVPGVEAGEVQQHVAGQVGLAQAIGLGEAVDQQRVARRRVHRERVARVQDRRRPAAPAAPPDVQLGVDVGLGNGVGGHDPLRLPHEGRAGAVDHGAPAERRADALLGRLVAQLALMALAKVHDANGHGASLARGQRALQDVASGSRRPARARGRRPARRGRPP